MDHPSFSNAVNIDMCRCTLFVQGILYLTHIIFIYIYIFVLNFLFHSPSPSPTIAHCTRFGEWSAASWEIQRQFRVSDEASAKQLDVRFLGLYHESEGHNMLKTQEVMCGRVISQWWDGSGAAGPRSRPAVPFGEAPPDLQVLALHQNEPKCLA